MEYTSSFFSLRAAAGRFLRLVLLCAGIGVVTGCGWAAAVGVMHGSFEAGFWKTVYVNVRSETARLGLLGAAAGAALGLIVAAQSAVRSRAGSPARRGRLTAWLRKEGVRPWPYVVILALGLAGAAAIELVLANRYIVLAAVAAAFVLCILLLVSRRAARSALMASDPRLEAFLAGLYAAVAHLAAVWLTLGRYAYDPQLNHVFVPYVLHAEFLAAAALLIASSAAVFFLVWSHRRAVSAERPRIGAGLIIAFLLAAGALLVWASAPLASGLGLQAGNPRNVVLIGIDTLRYDYTTMLERPEEGPDLTPNLRRIASRGTVFTRAISQAPWTMPSFASVLTGRYPADHGADATSGKLRGRQITLTEVLKEAGYSTGAVVGTFFVTSIRGFDQGFDYFNEDYNLGYWPITCKEVTDRSIEFIEENRGRNFFLFTHYYDPHFAYRDLPGRDFADGYGGWLKGSTLGLDALLQQRQDLDAADIRYLTDSYREEIADTDAQIGRILDRIDALGLTGETAVVVVADHGEEFMERGWIGHSATLHCELIHVPLVMSFPDVAPAEPVVRGTVETRAVFPTVLDYLDVPWATLDPPSLLPLIAGASSGDDSARRAEAFSFTGHIGGERRLPKLLSLQTDRWKLIIDRQRGRTCLYDLESDPGETIDVGDANPEIARELEGRLNAWMDALGERPRRRDEWGAGPEGSDALKKLGY